MKKIIKEEMWVELEVKMSDYRVRSYRGLINCNDFEKLIKGVDIPFMKLSHCYWYCDPEEGNDSDIGTFKMFGSGPYQNFTGDLYFKASLIIDIAPLKDGLNGEPKAS